jgi:hypothetical protein
MARAVRDNASTGLLYGQGEFVTKHHALILAREPQEDGVLADARAQESRRTPRSRSADRRTTRRPSHDGDLHYLHDPQGQPIQAPSRPHGPARTLARIPAAHTEICPADELDRYPIGARGRIHTAGFLHPQRRPPERITHDLAGLIRMPTAWPSPPAQGVL